ncbi:hypothetical protein EV643_102466 [Kribbella sp. VKM Ac-2527]|uniref:Uncharacterized protein n=1 Tax=Kribbella caucasensis TaxID=2512215 RepID=A0A4R6KM29_9ACTN|nr:hypothetical protein [Kribbella sp. VKM Ac-2527]TDO52627.1 hypothetical protein EV643_102466 [Kribbella sp. VKM Ac-2527]
MNEVSPEPVATGTAEDLIRLILGDVVELDDLTAEPHRLSEEAVVFRARSLQRRRSPERIREGVREILTELELYRTGYDSGYDAGYEQAIADVLACVHSRDHEEAGAEQ